MSCNDKNNYDQDSSCVADILKFIAELQDCATGPTTSGCATSCEMPFLGANPAMPVANTRPVVIKPRGCCDNFSANFFLPGPGPAGTFISGSTEIFRVESVDSSCAVLRPLTVKRGSAAPLGNVVTFMDVFGPTSAPGEPTASPQVGTLVATSSCITVDLAYFSSVQCLPDVNIPGV
ncbi:CotY/CotZ family spore coat protein [Ectobacillus funiculus]|uniref:CotY/CotZ family spore coat protein n=1 Tax=Ectobacillus funiculus TaxID=137993 RepID=UPI00397BA7B4